MKIKKILPILSLLPLAATTFGISSCSKKGDDQSPKPAATKVEWVGFEDGQEYDVAEVSSLKLKAKVTPAEADQDVVFKIVKQEGVGKVACSTAGTVNVNKSIGTCTFKAVSKTNPDVAAPFITFRFFNSKDLNFVVDKGPEGKDTLYVGSALTRAADLTHLVIPSKFKHPETGEEMPVGGVYTSGFYSSANLRYLLLPENEEFTFICPYAFNGCASLTSVKIPNNVLYIQDYAFAACATLKEFTIGNKVRALHNACLRNCASLVELDLPESIVAIGAQAFYGCHSLEEMTIPKNVYYIGDGAFTNCWVWNPTVDPENKNFVSVTGSKDDDYHDGIYSRGQDGKPANRMLTVNLTTAINGKTFKVPTSVTSIDSGCFMTATGLSAIELHDNISIIGSYAFTLCSGIKSIHIPASLKIINSYLLCCCTSMDSIVIPSTVEKINSYAFLGCDCLEKVTFEDSAKWKVVDLEAEVTVESQYDPKVGGTILGEEVTAEEKNAYYLAIWGYDQSSIWIGGYSTCTWTKILINKY